jgi:cytochrome P450
MSARSGRSFPPGPRGVPVFGVSLQFARGPFRFFMDLRRDFGSFVHYSSLGTQFFALYSPELIEHVLVRNAKNYMKDPFVRSWDRVFGRGLLVAEGDHWRRERRIIQPAFHRERISTYTTVMADSARKLSKTWGSGGEKNVGIEMMALTLDIVLRALFGEEAGVDLARVKVDLLALGEFFEWTLTPWGRLLRGMPLPRVRRYRHGADDLRQLILEMIASRRKTPSQGNDLLSTLIRLRDEDGSSLSDEQVRDELLTFFLAGHETTSLALTYSFYLLARHSDVQRRLQAEIDEKGEESPLLSQVLQEALRLYPPAWVMGREALAMDELEGFEIPAKAIVSIPIYAIHRDPKYFDDPEAFKPERWTDEFKQELPRAAYLPFGYGPRMCIGSVFAMTEAKLILAELLKKFTVSGASERPPLLQASITARPREDVLLHFSER